MPISGGYIDIPNGPDTKPLFGEARPRDRVVNLVVGFLTFLSVIETLISSFVFPQWPPHGVNVFFAFCIILNCLSNILLIYWYRQGDVEPKFRTLIYFNAAVTVLLCICCNVYVHGVT